MLEFERPDWQKQAACRGMDVNIFFPRRGETEKAKQAKRICSTCPVIEECREYSFELAQEFDTIGIFGGLASINRKHMMRDKGIKMVYRQSHKTYME